MSKELSPHAKLVVGNGGLEKVVIDHPRAAGEVYLYGGHITHWQPAGHEPALFLSPAAVFEKGKAIRGGIPVCLPWFGALAGKPGEKIDAPMHGLVRTRPWQFIDATETADGVTVRLKIEINGDESPAWTSPFAAELSVTFGRSLAVALKVTNTGPAPMKFEEALHTYYSVDDIYEVTVSGLHHTYYLDKPSGNRRTQQGEMAITFGQEIDRVYLATDHPCGIHDPSMARTITVEKQNSRSTVVWNPAERRAAALADVGSANWPKFVCVETANVGDAAVTLAPGAAHDMHLLVRLDGIAVL